MSSKPILPIIGQEAICPDGLGRVTGFDINGSDGDWIKVRTVFNDRSLNWSAQRVELINPRNPLPLGDELEYRIKLRVKTGEIHASLFQDGRWQEYIGHKLVLTDSKAGLEMTIVKLPS